MSHPGPTLDTEPAWEPGDTRLRFLHHQGELVEAFPEVPGLLADLDELALSRAGALLSELDPDEVLRRHPQLTAIGVAVTGSSTLRPLVSPLSAHLARHGFVPRIRVGGYRQYAIELQGTRDDVFTDEPDLTVCLLDAEEVIGRLRAPWTVPDVEHALRDLRSLLEQLAVAYQAGHSGPLVLNTIPLPRYFAAQLVDYRSRAMLGAAWREFNMHLLRFGAQQPGVVVLDTEPLCETAPPPDPRLSSYAKVQFSEEFFACYAREIGHLARALSGRTSKCLVVDLDGTLWGGTLADDGPDGIEVSEGFRGEAFHAFQSAVRQLGSQGPLVAVCSKNDEELVRKVLSGNQNLALTEKDLVAIVANWGPKPDNLVQLSEQLGVGLDSLVFVDDSPTERGMMRDALPSVHVVAVDSDEPALHVDRLLAEGWFVTREVTAEDRKRDERYRTEQQRLRFRERTDSLSEYLAGLGTTVELSHATPGDAARVAQLTQRTNQFNLMTVRLDTAAVLAMVNDPDRDIITIRCADRFGTHGLVGAIITWWGTAQCHDAARVLHIDNFVLSCRVLARGIESATLRALLVRAKQNGAEGMVAGFRQTDKNQRHKDFYPSSGFTQVNTGPDGTVRYAHDLTALPSPVPHIEVDARLDDPEEQRTAR